MNVGMLWFDQDANVTIEKKVARAAEFYNAKYGISPNICYVHPSMIPEEKSTVGQVEVRANMLVLPNHFWIGINGSKPKQAS